MYAQRKLTVLLWGIGAALASLADCWVSQTGNDGAAGTEQYPFATVAHAVTALGADGGIVHVLKGDYPLTEQIKISTPVRVIGETGKPEDVRFYRDTTAAMRIFYLDNIGSSVENCTIEGGYLGSSGVGVYISANGGTLVNCIVRNNYSTATHAEDIAIYSAANKDVVSISRCVITNNNTSSGGGNAWASAVLLNAGRIDNCFIGYNRNDSTAVRGGALGLFGSSVAEHCTVCENDYYAAAGLLLQVNTQAKAINCLVVKNTTKCRVDDVNWTLRDKWNGRNNTKSNDFVNCVFDRYAPNSATSYGGVEVLVADAAKGDYRLTPASKAVDFGTDEGCVSTVDLAGNPRTSGVGRDAGCYELQQEGFQVGFKADKLNGLIPTTVRFTAVTVGAPDGDSITYKWDFDNDGTYDRETQDLSVDWECSAVGTYDVRLTAVSQAMGEKTLVVHDFFLAGVPRIYVVKDNPTAAPPYDTWATAAADIPTAVAAAGIGTEVVISNETYPVSSTISLNHAITLRGFTGRPEDVILDGGRFLNNEKGPYCRVLTLYDDEHESVRDLTIANGRSSDNGPGVAIYGGGVVSNCIVRGCYNTAHHAKSMAVYCETPFGLVTHCVITNNTSDIYDKNYSAAAYASAGRIANSLIGWNKPKKTSLQIGGILTLDGTGLAENCTVVRNESVASAGINLASATAKAVNCVVAANTTTGTRAEDCCWSILDTTAKESGVKGNFINCVFDKSAPNATCYAGAKLLFVDADGGDFHPATGSKAIDFGTLDIEDESEVDLDGKPRRNGDAIDAGCWEYLASAFEAGFTADAAGSFEPWCVNCTAVVGGAGKDDELAYYWDFDNDGVCDVTTSVATVSYTYPSPGKYDASLVVTNLTKGGAATAPAVNKNFFSANPRTLYVVCGNAGARAPYATWETAAADIQSAVNWAAEGATVVVSNGTYEIDRQISVTVPITLCGLTGRPEDVIVDAGNRCRVLDINAGATALVHSMSIRNGDVTESGAGLNVYGKGGAVSNLVVSGCRSKGKWVNGPLYFANENCRISHCVVTNCICACGTDGGYMTGVIQLDGGATASHCLVSRCSRDSSILYPGYGNAAIRVGDGSADWCTVVSNTMHAIGGINVVGSGSFHHCLIAGNVSMLFDDPRHAVWGAIDKYTNDCVSFNDDERAADPAIVGRQQTNVTDRVRINDTCILAEGGLVSLLPKFETRGRFTQGRNSPGLDVVPADAVSDMPATDVFGHPRKIGPGYDLGAVESFNGGLIMIVR